MKNELKNRLRRIYYGMFIRCYYEKGQDYLNYHSRNITVCAEWSQKKKGLKLFRKWALENGYKYIPHNGRNTITLDRIDNNKGYSPDNCRWITDKEQSKNKSNNRIVEYKGKKYSMIELSEKLNIPYHTLASQFRRKSKNIGIVREKRTVKQIAQYALNGNLIKIWNSTMEIERELGINHSQISKCCYHKQGIQQCRGYKWEFIIN